MFCALKAGIRSAVAITAMTALLACANPDVAHQSTAKAVEDPSLIDNGDAKSGDVHDPMEGVNRVTSDFNQGFRKYLLDPVVDTYKFITPVAIQIVVSNMTSRTPELPLKDSSSIRLLGSWERPIWRERWDSSNAERIWARRWPYTELDRVRTSSSRF
jgi:hypothetical protein